MLEQEDGWLGQSLRGSEASTTGIGVIAGTGIYVIAGTRICVIAGTGIRDQKGSS